MTRLSADELLRPITPWAGRRVEKAPKADRVRLTWRVPPSPRHGKREWPVAYYESGEIAARLECRDSYEAEAVRTGNHAPLCVGIAVPVGDGAVFCWLSLPRPFVSLSGAKFAARSFLTAHSEYHR